MTRFDALSSELLAALDANGVAAIFVKDLGGTYRFVNRACELLWRRSRDEILGRTDDELLPADCARALRANDRQVVESGQSLQVEEVFEGPSGREVFLSSKTPLWDANGAIVGLCGVATNITELKRVERSLRESEARFHRLADSVPVLIWLSDKHKEGIYFNRTWLEFTGRTAAQERGDGWIDGMHPADRAEALEACAVAFAGRRPFTLQFRLRHADGRYRWVLDTGAPRFDAEGEFQGYVGTCVDISERIAAEGLVRASEERLRFTIEAAGVASWDWDLAGDRVVWSENLPRLLGGLAGTRGTFEDILQAIDPRDRESVRSAIAIARDRAGDFHVEYRLSRPQGEVRWIESKGRVFGGREASATRIAGVCIDVTERRHSEERLRDQAAALVEADRRKDAFLAMLAHELRNPLAPIQYSAELLKLDGNPRTSQHADTILRQIGHMRRIVDDLLDVARITRGSIRLQIRRIALRDVITDALAIVKPLIGERRHHLEYVPPPVGVQVQGDEARLAQVFANLLHNAAKFTPPGGHLAIRVATTENAVSVTVQDDGRGIRPSALPHVFDLFDQDETQLDRTEGGLGVGLTLVKKLVEMHGGTTSVESAGAGCGSAFTVELPLHEAPDAPPLDEQTGTRTAVSRRVLVVDDNRDAADGLTRLLRLGGHTVRTAYDGQEALDVARAFDPEVVLLDIGLPRIDGLEVARQLKADDSPPTVVAVTGYGKSGELARRAERFDHYLLKPVSLDIIEEILRGSD